MKKILRRLLVLIVCSDLIFGLLLILFLMGIATKKVMSIYMIYLVILALVNLIIYWYM